VPDETSLSGDLSGSGGALPPVHGSFDVKEVFGEIGIPVIQDMPFIKDLSVTGGYRYSDYSLSGDVSAYKGEVSYAPDSMVRIRGSYQRSVRAPNINELFTPQQITNTSVVSSDPCSAIGSGGSAAASLAACERTGVTANQYGDGRDPAIGGTDKIPQCPADQCAVVDGGNLKLTPETSNTYSGGVVITPNKFISGLTLSVDYFNIDIENAISTLPINIVLSDCLNSGTHCDLVVRQADGALFSSNQLQGGYISGTNINIGHIQTEGVDFDLNYRFDLDKVGLKDKGLITVQFDGTWTTHLNNEPIPGQGTYNCAGLYGNTCGVPTPNWRHVMSATWTTPWRISVRAQWRFIGGTSLDNNVASNPLLYAGSFDAQDAKIGDYSYLDLSGTWMFKPGLVLRAGVNNLLDKDPPILNAGVTGSGTPNTYNNYDLLGRQIFVGLKAQF
jgi:outer membrane receptor protein involved in Fe transport